MPHYGQFYFVTLRTAKGKSDTQMTKQKDGNNPSCSPKVVLPDYREIQLLWVTIHFFHWSESFLVSLATESIPGDTCVLFIWQLTKQVVSVSFKGIKSLGIFQWELCRKWCFTWKLKHNIGPNLMLIFLIFNVCIIFYCTER